MKHIKVINYNTVVYSVVILRV